MTLLLLMSHCSSCPEIQGVGNIGDLDLSNYKCNYYLSNFIFTAITRLLIKHGLFHVFTLFWGLCQRDEQLRGPAEGSWWQIDKVILTENCCEKLDGSCCAAIKEPVVERVFQEENLSWSQMEQSVLLGKTMGAGGESQCPVQRWNLGVLLLQPILPQGCWLLWRDLKIATEPACCFRRIKNHDLLPEIFILITHNYGFSSFEEEHKDFYPVVVARALQGIQKREWMWLLLGHVADAMKYKQCCFPE